MIPLLFTASAMTRLCALLLELRHRRLESRQPRLLLDAEAVADLAAIQARVGGAARRRWVIGGADRHDRDRTAGHGRIDFEDAAGEFVPADRGCAAIVIETPSHRACSDARHHAD